MRKEVIIAILIGLFFGLIITFGVHQARQSIADNNTTKHVSETIDEVVDANSGKLALHSPEDEIIQEEETTSVTGTTLPDIYVVIFSNDEETVTTSDSSGNFSVEIDLKDGSNIVSVFAVDEDGNTISEERTVIVTSEPLSIEVQPKKDEEASDSADLEDEDDDDEEVSSILDIFRVKEAFAATEKDLVELEEDTETETDDTSEDDDENSDSNDDEELDKDEESTSSSETTQNLKDRINKIVEEKSKDVQKSLDEMSKEKKGFIGAVSRVTQDTITIKNIKGTNILPFTDVLVYKDKKKISPDKIAVDDWALVMGWIEDDSFVPKKIIISSETLRPKTHIVMIGTIEDIGKAEIAFKSRSSEATDALKIDKKTKYQNNMGEEAEKTDFIEDTQALLIGYKDDDNSTITVLRALAPFDIDEDIDETDSE